MIDRLKCLFGFHCWETHLRDMGTHIRVWKFCKRCMTMRLATKSKDQ